jgi:hypothetical protein
MSEEETLTTGEAWTDEKEKVYKDDILHAKKYLSFLSQGSTYASTGFSSFVQKIIKKERSDELRVVFYQQEQDRGEAPERGGAEEGGAEVPGADVGEPERVPEPEGVPGGGEHPGHRLHPQGRRR